MKKEKDYAVLVPVFKALADETRLKIIDMLCAGELCGCKILECFHFTQPTLSYHMKLLCDSGLVVGRRDGAWIWYSLDREKFKDIKILMAGICADSVSGQSEDCNGKY